jgi:hypothetical protein
MATLRDDRGTRRHGDAAARRTHFACRDRPQRDPTRVSRMGGALMDIALEIEGVFDRGIVKAIRKRVHGLRRQISKLGEWRVTIAPSETRGEWGVSGISCVGRVDVVRSVLLLLEADDACGRCGKPRPVRFSKSLWARSVRPQGRQRPCAGSFYAFGAVKRSW